MREGEQSMAMRTKHCTREMPPAQQQWLVVREAPTRHPAWQAAFPIGHLSCTGILLKLRSGSPEWRPVRQLAAHRSALQCSLPLTSHPLVDKSKTVLLGVVLNGI